MNLFHTRKYAKELKDNRVHYENEIEYKPEAVLDTYTVQEAKNIVITLDGHLASKYLAKKVMFINDPLAPKVGWL